MSAPNGESDWEDLDLLTIDLARERLDEEIAALRAQLKADTGPDEVDLTAARARLEALTATRKRMGRPPVR